MKLSPDATLYALNRAKRRYAKFQERFDEFSKALEWFDSPQSQLKGVEHERSDDNRTETIKFEGVTIAFRLTRLISAVEGGPRILVLCTLENPVIGEDKPHLGSFTFNDEGLTDFEAADMMDVPDVMGNAPDIVIHYLHLALGWQPPV